MSAKTIDSFGSRATLSVRGNLYCYCSLVQAERNGLQNISSLPFSLKVLAENLLRFEDGRSVTAPDMTALSDWVRDRRSTREIAFRPARVLMQDFTGVPAVVDLAAMREAMKMLGSDPGKINPLIPVDLVCDHSVIVDEFGTSQAFARNAHIDLFLDQQGSMSC
jgi:aconitate hydratase A / 2-methylisocitrate dehydratase